MKETLIDIETYCEADIKKCGLYRYVSDPSFEILLIAWATDGGEGFGETKLADLASGDPFPQELLDDFKDSNVIHYGFIEKIIEELGNTYHIREIAFDRWGAVQMTQNLEGMGFTVVPFGQGFKDMSPPTKEFYKLLMEGRIVHGGNPIMAWMAGNVVVDTDPAGNIKPTKAKSPEKIDGIVAAIMALDRCIRNEGQQQGSIYDERDMIVF